MDNIKTCRILKDAKTIAVVGISNNEAKISRKIAEYLHGQGYKVFGVNPSFSIAGGIEVFPSLRDIPGKVDIVNVFRRSETIPDLIPDVLEINPKVLWLQLGIWNDQAAELAEKNSITVIQDTCIYVEHSNCFK
ncbi:MAG: CoA-binding protein [Bacteroidetes bacterium]|nr:CoA-binding protein [Bacteroidota bacterium]MBU1677696.1 CoA-binding protein [Bacteroidota bacterium]MBU2505545.1 CoA-binding protein [Bacteroidota bacterium]